MRTAIVVMVLLLMSTPHVSAQAPFLTDPSGDALPPLKHLDLLALDLDSGNRTLGLHLTLAAIRPDMPEAQYTIRFRTPGTPTDHLDEIDCRVGHRTSLLERQIHGSVASHCEFQRVTEDRHTLPFGHFVTLERTPLAPTVGPDRIHVTIAYDLLAVLPGDRLDRFTAQSFSCLDGCHSGDIAWTAKAYVLA